MVKARFGCPARRPSQPPDEKSSGVWRRFSTRKTSAERMPGDFGRTGLVRLRV